MDKYQSQALGQNRLISITRGTDSYFVETEQKRTCGGNEGLIERALIAEWGDEEGLHHRWKRNLQSLFSDQ